MSKEVRTRFAPSPTGKLHIGGARTALFCYLYAKNKNGKFLLRLEDTDKVREIEDGEENIISSLEWLKIFPDFSYRNVDTSLEFPQFRQSEKIERYLNFANQLLESKNAYKCFCEFDINKIKDSKNTNICGAISYDNENKPFRNERICLKNQKQSKIFSIRIKMPENKILHWKDGIRGEISFNSNDISDWVAIKSDKMPTYNFANPIDDYDMKITDIFRGEEHISNTPKQILINELFNFDSINYNHLTIIVDSSGKKLSKRDKNTPQYIEMYKNNGYLPIAIFNFLALLGWTSKEVEREFFSMNELIESFDSNRLSKSPSTFDVKKLNWMNSFYIKKMTEDELFDYLNLFVKSFLDNQKYSKFSINKWKEIFLLFQSSIEFGIQINSMISIFFDERTFNKEESNFFLENWNYLQDFYNCILNLNEEFDNINITKIIKDLSKENDKSEKFFFQLLRKFISGIENGPSIVKIIVIFGKENLIRIFKKFKSENNI